MRGERAIELKSERGKRRRRAGNKPALILILSGATGGESEAGKVMPSYLFNSPLDDGEKFQNSGL